jgi:hypothetical protein
MAITNNPIVGADLRVHPSEEGDQQRVTLALSLTGSPQPEGSFEILAITAGVGNGLKFGADVLRASLSLWAGVECFIDHNLAARSVRDLAGVLSAPSWDDSAQGIRAILQAVGPGGPTLKELAAVALSEGAKPAVGFSADFFVEATKDKTVTRIVKVLSVDLVVHPARGGQFVRALNQEVTSMKVKKIVNGVEVEVEEEQPQVSTDVAALQNLLGVQQEQARLAEEAEKTRGIRVQMCEYLLTSGLAAARLPAPAVEMVRKQFAGRAFEPAELTAAIEDARKLVSDLTAAQVVVGPRIGGMVTTNEQLQAAVDDLLGAPREESQKSVKPARLSGIRELYMTLTGDYELHGGFHGDRIQLATTSDFSGLVKNALNKIIVQKWAELGKAGYSWWEQIAVVEHFNSLQSITGTLIGTVGDLPTVAEGAEYTELAVGDSPETATFTKYGGYIPLTLELIDRDETRKLAAYPRELAIAGLRKVSSLVAAIFTASSGVGPTMADTGALFNATAVTTKGGHCNLLTTALSGAQWEVVSAAMYNQPLLIKNDTGYYGTGPKMGINPRYMLVPRPLQLTAKQILYPELAYASGYNSQNQQQGSIGDVVTVPEWTDTTDWAAVADPAIAPAIFVGERFGIMPQVFVAGDEQSPAVFTNDRDPPQGPPLPGGLGQ